MGARSFIEDLLLRASQTLGGPVLCDLLSRGRVRVLCYHGTPTRSEFNGVENAYGYNVPLAELERQLEYVQRRCNVLSVDDLLSARNVSSTRMNVIVTFDDGYENNYTNAFPLLERLGVPATFAIPTAFVLQRTPLWNDVVEGAIDRSTVRNVELSWNGEERFFSCPDRIGRLRLLNWAMRRCVEAEQEQRPALIAHLLEALGVGADPEQLFTNDDYRPMSAAQIKKMQKSTLVEFASHSVHHFLLSKLELEAMRSELLQSKRELEKMTGAACRILCLPGGAYNQEVLEQAFSAGYECIFNSDPGTTRPRERVFNRYAMFRRVELPRFADEVHGPVMNTIRAARRFKGAVRSILSPGAAS